MFKNYFKIAWRNLVKSSTYSIINIAGLAVGLSGFIIMLLYLNYELSYDTWHPSLEKVYKVSVRTDDEMLEQTPAPLARFLQEKIPAIEAATSIAPAGSFEILLQAGDKKIYQKGSVDADSSFLKVFPYKIVSGDAATALNKPNAMIVSQEVARKLFGDANPVGKTVTVFNRFDAEVTAVMEVPDKPSDMEVQFVWRSPYEKQNLFWENYSFQTYVKTKQAMPVEKLENTINRIYYDHRLKKDNQSWENFRQAGHQAGLFADAMKDLHNFPKHGSSHFSTVTLLLVLAALLLVAGSINFSNLSVAASVRRAKEIGVRKVLGSGKRQLLGQFMGEIALQCAISLCLAVLLVNILLPLFNRTFNIQLAFLKAGNAPFIAAQIIICLLFVIFLSGLYPAVFLSGFNITKVLKGNYSRGTKGMRFRNTLIIVQFAVSVFFIISILVVNRQMHFMQSSDRGFSGEQVMRIETTQNTREKDFETAHRILSGISGVQYVSKTTTVPGDALTDTSTFSFRHAGKAYRMASVKVSADYFTTLGIELLQGRLFINSYSDENTRSAIINETAARTMNLSDPLGATIYFPFCDSIPVQIVGVVKDFNVTGFESRVQPAVYTMGNKACMYQSGGALLVKLNSHQMQQTIAAIEQAWKKIEPDFPIRYSFLDDNFQKLLTVYNRLQKIIGFFTIAAILIAITGLFALTAFLTGQRTKEIGIRKVLGAGTHNLAALLSRDYIRLVAIAILIALPLSWWAVNQWLQNFAYHINTVWWLLLLAALIVMAIALLTIGMQAIKAALANPVKSLRTE